MDELQTANVAEGNDYAAHEQTYRGFLTIMKWATIHVVVILVLMAIFLL